MQKSVIRWSTRSDSCVETWEGEWLGWVGQVKACFFADQERMQIKFYNLILTCPVPPINIKKSFMYVVHPLHTWIILSLFEYSENNLRMSKM